MMAGTGRVRRAAGPSAGMICCTRMENSPQQAQPSSESAAGQRLVKLQSAAIRADGSKLSRTAQFTDGSTCAVEMNWNDVRRVAAFRRDVMTQPVLCVAISDPANIVVLDESMEGWKALLEGVSRNLKQSPSFSEWQEKIGHESHDSYWTVLFRSTE